MKARTFLWAACGVAGVVLAGLLIWRTLSPYVHFQATPEPPRPSVSAVQIGGPFQLVDQNGAPRDQSLLNGRWSAVFFGFTHCPDICPTTLQTLGAAKEALGAEGERLQIVFISVDPERDTPAALKAYLESGAFAPGVVGLTGSASQVRNAANVYRATYSREGEGEAYVMNHTSLVYLMDPQGRFVRPLRPAEAPESIARDIRSAMAAGNASAS